MALLFVLLMRRLPHKFDSIEGAADRGMMLMLDGLRAHPGTPLSGRAIT